MYPYNDWRKFLADRREFLTLFSSLILAVLVVLLIGMFLVSIGRH